MSSKVKVHCPICTKELPIDYFECDLCGNHNPQLHLIRRTKLEVMIADEVLRPLEKFSIRSGRPMDDLVIEAIEEWLTRQGPGNAQ